MIGSVAYVDQDDAEKDWTFDADSFDFIHSRNLSQSISNWPKLIAEIFRLVLFPIPSARPRGSQS